MQGRRVTRARLDRGGLWFVHDGGERGVKEEGEIGEEVVVVERARKGGGDGRGGKGEERGRLEEKLGLHGQ